MKDSSILHMNTKSGQERNGGDLIIKLLINNLSNNEKTRH